MSRFGWWRLIVKWAEVQKNGISKAAAYLGGVISAAIFTLILVGWEVGKKLGASKKVGVGGFWIFVAGSIVAGAAAALLMVQNVADGTGHAPELVYAVLSIAAFAIGGAVGEVGEHGGEVIGKRKKNDDGAFLADKREQIAEIMPARRLPGQPYERWQPGRPMLGFPILKEWKPETEGALGKARADINARKQKAQKVARRRGERPPEEETTEMRNAAAAKVAPSLLRKTPALMGDEGHAIILGASGSGKTVSLVVPQILSPAYDPANQVVVSAFDELYNLTHEHRRTCGQVSVYDPTGSGGVEGHRWSFISHCDTYDNAAAVASTLIGYAELGGDNAFFSHMAERALVPMLLAANAGGKGLEDLLHWVANPKALAGSVDKYGEPKMGTIESILLEQKPTGWARALSKWQGFMEKANTSEKAWQQDFSSIEAALKSFDTEEVVESTKLAGGPVIDPKEFVEGRGGTLYIKASLQKQRQYQPVFGSILQQIINAAYESAAENDGELQNRLVIIVDEAANTAPIPDLDEVVASARGYGINLWLYFQNYSQIEAKYPKLAGTIINNATARLFLGGSLDEDTLRLGTMAVGQAKKETHSETKGEGRSTSEQVGETMQDLLPPSLLRQMKKGVALLLYGDLPPVVLELNPWFLDPLFRQRAGADPLPTVKPPKGLLPPGEGGGTGQKRPPVPVPRKVNRSVPETRSEFEKELEEARRKQQASDKELEKQDKRMSKIRKTVYRDEETVEGQRTLYEWGGDEEDDEYPEDGFDMPYFEDEMEVL